MGGGGGGGRDRYRAVGFYLLPSQSTPVTQTGKFNYKGRCYDFNYMGSCNQGISIYLNSSTRYGLGGGGDHTETP